MEATVTINLTSDSDNSYPGLLELTIDNDQEVKFRLDSRRFTVDLKDLQRAIRVLEASIIND